jgi:hypothetical protein
MDDKNVVGFWRRLLEDAGKHGRGPDDLDFLSNLVSYLMVFLPLRGWNLKGKPLSEAVESLTDFILRGLGIP